MKCYFTTSNQMKQDRRALFQPENTFHVRLCSHWPVVTVEMANGLMGAADVRVHIIYMRRRGFQSGSEPPLLMRPPLLTLPVTL